MRMRRAIRGAQKGGYVTDQVRQLDAERLRPPPRPEPPIEELMKRLIGALHDLYRTPPDKAKEAE